MGRLSTVALVACLATGACKHGSAPSAAPLRVAAASDLAEAFTEVGAAYEKETGQKVTFTFGATGLLAKQIAEGAPYDLFAAANLAFVDDAINAGACDGATKEIYAEGRLALWTKGDAGVVVNALSDLTRPEVVHVAIANPEHAPYGKAAKQALEKSGVWSAIEKKIVYGENVQQTFQFAQSGNAEVAVIAMALATASGGRVVPVDPALHDPLRQGMVVCHGVPGAHREDDARKLEAFIGSDAGHAILRRHGLSVAGGEAASAR